ncbi:SDR family oxidoreductase [Roseibacterium sp. SDUM158017]|uniref:SDR family oxidoreductase n=1 Tax=Roseicyclus salinarum TaxID=3036773 RepID=UPI002414EF0C|nr:SDR family oxidoreductase [Roseibacterium sp. SDUM158017]MDG4650504.1 SDR family oxidoreductase [Roseibacterium sp. SDUM158017]
MPQPSSMPAQTQDRMPADEYRMEPAPDWHPRHPGVGKLKGKAAIVTGGDSGIGRAVAVLFAREGARVGIVHLQEDRDAQDTREAVEAEGGTFFEVKADIGRRDEAFAAIGELAGKLGGIDILVNNAAMQFNAEDIRDITEEQLRRTFDSNVMGQFFCTQAALDHLPEGGAIVNTASVNAFKGNAHLVDYSATRGAITAFSRSMAQQLAGRGIRVNCVAPGPVWTPFIPGSLPPDMVEGFGDHVPMGRPGQPWEIATSYLFLASDDGNYFTGQTLHPNGGVIVGS